MYVDSYHDKVKDLIKIVERVDGKRVYKEYKTDYSFYIEDPNGRYKSTTGKTLGKIPAKSFKELKKNRGIYNHKQLYESDIRQEFRCIEHNYDHVAPKLNMGFFDIEVDFDPSRGFADPSTPFNKITAITVYLEWLGQLVTLAIPPKTMTHDEAVNVCTEFDNTFIIDDEKVLLDTFLDLIDDCDILSGWNSEGYDIPYTTNRIKMVLGKNEIRRLCLWDQFPSKRTYERYGKEQETFDLVGRVHLDYLALYRKYTYHEMHSYSLDAIAKHELNETKTPYQGTLDELYNNDFRKFIEYNRQDTLLLHKLDQKLRFIDLTNQIAHANGVLLQTTMGSVAQIDQAVIRYAHEHGMMVPDKNRDRVEHNTAAAGAYVAYPKKGQHKWVGSVDINSLYPSVIRSLNMSPETIIGQLLPTHTGSYLQSRIDQKASASEAWEGVFSTLEFDAVQDKDRSLTLDVVMEDGTEFQASGAEIYEIVYNSGKKWCISSNGTIFSYDNKGIIPGLLEKWYAERQEYQKTKGEYQDLEKNEKDPVKKKEYSEQVVYWDKIQLVRKILLNSAYGALLNPGSRFYRFNIGQSTTLTGRTITKHMNSKINEIITGEYDYKGDAVIYSDTDSAYFSAYPMLKDDIDKGDIPWSKEDVISLYDNISDVTTDSFTDFMVKTFNVTKNNGSIIASGREIVASNALFIKKKRYAAMIYDLEGYRTDIDGKSGKLKVMGLDLKRSDTPADIQDFLEKVLLQVLEDGKEDDIIEYIRDFKKEYHKRPSWDKGTPKRVNNLTNHTKIFNKTGKCGVGHAMAAINWNRLKKLNGDRYSIDLMDGAKVIVCKLKKNHHNMTSIAYPVDELHLPDWFTSLEFDDAAMEAAVIDKKIDNLLSVLKWDLSKTDTSTVFTDLFDF